MKILIVKLSSIGDIVHALPALANIKRELPDAEIGWAVDTRYAEILRGNTMIDHLIEIDTGSMRGGKVVEEMLLNATAQLGGLRKHKFDVALDMQGLWKSASVARYSGAKKRWGFSKTALREPSSRFLLTDTVEIQSQTHVIRKNIALAAKALGMVPVNHGFEFPIASNSDHAAEAEAIAVKAGNDFVIVNPAGGWVTKLWHPENYGALADLMWEKLGLFSVVVTAPAEEQLASAVMANTKCGRAVIAHPSLKGFYELAKRSRLYIGGDTGPTHIAIAAGAPIVGIFGPTEWWRNGSLDPDDICIERNDIGCRVDCHRRTCSNWICMDISVETVFDAVARRLAAKPRK